jgi:hypothetical protein
MMSLYSNKTSNHKKRGFLITVLILIILVIVLAIVMPGFRKDMRGLVRTTLNVIKATLEQQEVVAYSQGDLTNIIFLHHSTGRNLIDQGQIREQFTELGFHFWDHGYNFEWLRDSSGNPTGYSFNVPGDNTDPDGIARIFTQRVYPLPLNTFSGLLQYEVIIFKSCFAPTSKISSDDQLAQYKAYYLQVRDAIDQHPDKLFLLLTQPPLNPAETNHEEADRARNLADWLASQAYLEGRTNFFVYDFFDALAEDDPNAADLNMLRSEFRNGADSHPNKKANQEIGPMLVEYVVNAIDTYRSFRGD